MSDATEYVECLRHGGFKPALLWKLQNARLAAIRRRHSTIRRISHRGVPETI
jgi:hypothetical protein